MFGVPCRRTYDETLLIALRRAARHLSKRAEQRTAQNHVAGRVIASAAREAHAGVAREVGGDAYMRHCILAALDGFTASQEQIVAAMRKARRPCPAARHLRRDSRDSVRLGDLFEVSR